MKRTSITLPDDLAALVEYEAAKAATTVSDVIRSAIVRTYLEQGREIGFASICDDPEMPAASRIEEALDGWADDLDRRRR